MHSGYRLHTSGFPQKRKEESTAEWIQPNFVLVAFHHEDFSVEEGGFPPIEKRNTIAEVRLPLRQRVYYYNLLELIKNLEPDDLV